MPACAGMTVGDCIDGSDGEVVTLFECLKAIFRCLCLGFVIPAQAGIQWVTMYEFIKTAQLSMPLFLKNIH